MARRNRGERDSSPRSRRDHVRREPHVGRDDREKGSGDRERERERGKDKERSARTRHVDSHRTSSPQSRSRSRRRQSRAISPESMPTARARSEGEDARRRSKWDASSGSTDSLPEWLKDLATPPKAAKHLENFKVLRMEGLQIRALIGKGGETIRDIRKRSGADIKIDHIPQDRHGEGTVTIVGDVEKTETMIREALASKGMVRARPQESQPDPVNDIEVPSELFSTLIGPAGSTLRDIRAKAGNTCFISVLPPQSGTQSVRVVGENKEEAKHLIRQKIEELRTCSQRPSLVPCRPPWPHGGVPPKHFPVCPERAPFECGLVPRGLAGVQGGLRTAPLDRRGIPQASVAPAPDGGRGTALITLATQFS